MPGVNPSNRRLRAAKNITKYGAPYGGFGFGNPARVGTSYHTFRLFSRIKPSCCGSDPVKKFSYSKCCNDPTLRSEITTKPPEKKDNNGEIVITTAQFKLNNLIIDMEDIDGTNEHISFVHIHDLNIDDTIVFIHPNTGEEITTVVTQVIEQNGRKISIRIADSHNKMGVTNNMTITIIKK